ncbi:MAG: zinc metalloprotease HtpX [Candidatus Woesearchaeota archaeon]|nr:zinc metalloprotease HtpX [Candidatus Woesearchaeota archaeon]
MGFFNQFKTAILLGILAAILIWIGSFFGTQGLVIGFAFAVLINVLTYFFSDKLVLLMYQAKPASKKEYPELHSIVEEISHKAGIPKPKVYIIQNESPNAFATGRNPKNAVVACTTGILKLLNKEELKGVIAHEISHVKNRDILIATIAATIAAVISYLAMMARYAGMFGGSRDRDNGRMFELLVLGILTPIIATLIQLAISRSREYIADSSAAKTIGSGTGLASALEKLKEGVKKVPFRNANKATMSLFIVNPLSAQGFLNLFSTHPPLDERISRLKKL